MCGLKTSCQCTFCIAVVLYGAGCQSYDRAPLDLGTYQDEWVSRGPGSEPVIDFALQLNDENVESIQFEPTDGVSLQEAEIIALVFNSDLRIARARALVAEMSADHAGKWDDPEFGFDLLRITESVPDPWVLSSAVSFTIPLSGRLEIERQLAFAEYSAELKRALLAEHQITYELRREWIHWSANHKRVEEMNEITADFESYLSSLERLADAGEVNRLEFRLFRLDQTSRQSEMLDLQGEISAGESRIRAILGLSPNAPITLVPSLALSLPEIAESATVESLAASSMFLSLKQAEYDVAEEHLHHEIKKQFPDISLGPQHESDEGQSRIGFALGIPIPILNANKEGIATARAARDAARIEYEAAFEKIVADHAVARTRLHTLRNQQTHVETTLVPLTDDQLREAIHLNEIGEINSLIVLESLKQSYTTKRQFIDITEQLLLTTNEIYKLLGSNSSNIFISNETDGVE